MNLINELKKTIKPADVLLIVPPFASIDRTCLAVHLLKACANASGFSTEILYANVLFASIVGELNYYFLCHTGLEREFVGERYFARVAYGKASFGNNGMEAIERQYNSFQRIGMKIDIDDIIKKERTVEELIESIATVIIDVGYPIVGLSSSFDQTAASISIINAIKKKEAQRICLIGGSNCLGTMSEGIMRLSSNIDYIFSGESELSFPEFLKKWRNGTNGKLPKIICQNKMTDLTTLPSISYDEYFNQLSNFMRGSKKASGRESFLQLETSRGCWKGQKKPCYFCGLNGLGINYRAKSTDQAINEIKCLVEKHPTRRIAMADCIIPPKYFSELLPRLFSEKLDLKMTYEVRSNITYESLEKLKKAGVDFVQPGIESLSTTHLSKMNKDVSASENLRFLRWARELELIVSWYLIYDIPNESVDDLYEILNIIPLIEHLDPPRGGVPLRLDRFSTYFDQQEKFGIENIVPWPIYSDILPEKTDIEKIAYHFDADYFSASRNNPDIIEKIKLAIETWQNQGMKVAEDRCFLDLQYISKEKYLLLDTRMVAQNKGPQIINREKASLLVKEFEASSLNLISQEDLEWAIGSHLIVYIDNMYIPLVTSSKKTKETLLK